MLLDVQKGFSAAPRRNAVMGITVLCRDEQPMVASQGGSNTAFWIPSR